MSKARIRERISQARNRKGIVWDSRGPSCHFVMALQATLLVSVVLIFAGCGGQAETPAVKGDATEEAVRFSNGDINLAGTLVLPAGPQRHPAVVLFHGSGPQSRDLFTARWFAAHGVAALAYDKRGVGESSGDFKKVPFMDLCDDGLAGIAYLKSRKEIDPQRRALQTSGR